MGGYGSGRHGGTVTAEATASFVLNIKSLAPIFQKGRYLSGEFHFYEGRFPILATVDLSNEWSCFVELIHLTRDERQDYRIVTDRVQLTRTEPTFGGHRWWFLCPRTACRATKLFLPDGGSHFWSRQAYGLGYACQREGRLDRLQRRAAMLNRQLGGEGMTTWDTPPPKPKWMRWRSYEQKYEAWYRAARDAMIEAEVCAAKILSRPAR